MNKKNLILFALSLMLSGVCMSQEKEMPVSICEDSEFSCKEVADLSESALGGSQDDALKLFWSSLDQENKTEALYWAQIAMENGSVIGRHNYASLLAQKDDKISLIRAKYHLVFLIKKGDRDSQSILREVEKKLNRKNDEKTGPE